MSQFLSYFLHLKSDSQRLIMPLCFHPYSHRLLSTRPKSMAISPDVQHHLQRVYLTVSFALLACAAGAYLHLSFNIGGLLTFFGCAGIMGISMLVNPFEVTKCFVLIMLFSLLEGASIAPVFPDPSVLFTGLMGMAVTYGCVSVSAIVANSQQFLVVGGLLSYAFAFAFWLRFFISFFDSSVVFNTKLVGGIPFFLGYFTFDNIQVILGAQKGDNDYMKHALILSTDFFALLLASPFISAKSGRSIKKWLDRKRVSAE